MKRSKRIIKYGGCVTGKEERQALIKSIDKSIKSRNWQAGEEAEKFEKELSKYLNVKHSILTNSGSSAGLLALSALELPRGSEVIISAVTFPTIFNIILQCGLVPVVVDCKVGTYGFDIKDVEEAITDKTRAIIAIHPLGNPVDMPELMRKIEGINKVREVTENKIYVIEDGCDALGTTINGKKVMSFGDLGITSTHSAHIISTGVGGVVFTDNKDLATRVRMYRDWGRQANTDKPHEVETLPADYNPRFVYEKIGYNLQILDLQAAMGRVQLRKIEKVKKARKKNFDYLYKNLQRISLKRENLLFPVTSSNADICWFAFPLSFAGDRGKLVAHLEKNGIETRSMFAGNITKHPAYKDSEYRISGELKDADYILEHSFWISCHNSLTKEDLEYIVKVFDEFFHD